MVIAFVSCHVTSNRINNYENGSNILKFEVFDFDNSKQQISNIPIDFKITNLSSDTIFMENPKCWVTTIPIIFVGTQRVLPLIKVKPDPNCKNDLLKIKPHDYSMVQYNYSLEKLVDINSNKDYIIHFEYSGNLYNANKVLFKSILISSNKVKVP
jgi:hypothetical protein